ncbi:zinc finger and BTB domain-containing protein 21 isoform X3 [Dipodomys spectabilis]|uniref:zinc finger and BTB domain-containing protein 21 isoform X3 n=1 Tax=Dipodomys spectabilis TaxID=105255 RepID=UPI001C53DB39|nr:zinc finger and BTB domain-containing protein 21 isoform X3 [Dipodomys spectabilis]
MISRAMEGLLHYINPAHAISLLSALNEERLKGQLCDVLLIVGDQKFRAHKNVLAASSEYFQSLFTNKENESQTVFQLDFCEPDAFDNVLNYIYSSSLFVEKGSLAAVQELGYSLGISFLTNIVSKAPQAPFPVCPNRKRVLVSEDDETSSQKRSVIVCQGRSEAQGKASSQNLPDLSHASRPAPSTAIKTSSSRPHIAKAVEPLHSLALADKNWPKEPAAGYTKSLEHSGSLDDPSRSSLVKRNAVLPSKPPSDRDAGDEKPGASSQLPKGRAIEMALKRPRPPVLSLRSSSETPYLLKESNKGSGQGEDRNLLYYSKLGLVIPSSGSASANQSIDRSGPLVKSLLRRSLSMDSQVPVYSPAIDLKSPQESPPVSNNAPGNVFCALAQKSALKDCTEKPALDDRPQVLQPHRLRSFSASQSTDREGASPVTVTLTEVRIKTEPSSPLSDPADIIRVTVGDGAAASRDPPVKTEEDPKDMSRLPAKRRFQADRRSPFKKARAEEPGPAVSGDSCEESASPPALDGNFPDSDLNKEEFEQGSHERLCRNTTVCPYCSLRFFSPALKQEHEDRCEYKKLTCLECMRTFKSSFSIWRHQVEVHNQNSMAPAENVSLPTLDHNGEVPAGPRAPPPPEPNKVNHVATPKEDTAFSDSSEQVNFDSEDSTCLPEDLSLSKQLKIHVKEEPVEEAEEDAPEASSAPKEAGPSKEAGLWPCEKCGKMFSAHRQLERHQELLCSVKPFICHVCHKAFRTNFRLWSHFQSHASQATEEPVRKEAEARPGPTDSPSPPPLPPPPPLPKIQPLEPDSPTGLPENPIPTTEKLFTPQESDTLFYHAPPLSAITFKRQFMCKLCHRTFKTAFSLWSHEQTHN